MLRKVKFKNQPQWYTFTYISILLAITYILLPTIPSHLPSAVNEIIMLTFTGSAFLGVIMQKNWYKAINFLSLICVVLLVFIVYFGKWKFIDYTLGKDFFSRVFTLFEFWIFWVISKSSIKFSDVDKKKILNYCLILMLITSLTTIIGCLKYPSAPRLLAGRATSDESSLFRRINIGGYEFVYGITLFVPFIIYLINKTTSKVSKLLYIIFLVIILITVTVSQYATALVLSMSFLIISITIFFMNSKKSQIIIIFILGITLVLLLSGAMVKILCQFRDFLLDYKMNIVSARIDEIIRFIGSGDWNGTSSTREDLRMQSLNVFLKSPLYGCLFEPQALGGHSEFLDIMGAGGMIGITMFIIPVMNYIKMIISCSKKKLFNIIIFFELFMFILLAYVNTLFTSPNIALSFFLIPTLLINNDDKMSSVSV